MIRIARTKRLTVDEVKGLFTTELFAELMRYKYQITADTVAELEFILKELETELEFTWYFHRDGGYLGRAGMLYVSAPVDSKTLEKISNEDWCKNRFIG